jgi:cytochrome P450
VQAEEAGDRLTSEELTANVGLLFAAGHETTANLIGNGLLALHRQPGEWARLKAEPALMANAVEEMLRFDSSVQMTGRTTVSEVEIGGVTIPAGQSVVAFLGAADRDPAVHAEPDRLDLGRKAPDPM